MNHKVLKSILTLLLFMMTLCAEAQQGLAINEAFEQYGTQKGCKMVTLMGGRLRGYELQVYKSLTYRKYAEEISEMVGKDRAKARKIKEVMTDGRLSLGYYTMPPVAEGINCYVLYRYNPEYNEGVLIYIEGALTEQDIMKITKR